MTTEEREEYEVHLDSAIRAVREGRGFPWMSIAGDFRDLISHIEELTVQFAKETEEHAALKKENQRLRDVILKNIIVGASDDQLHTLAEKPSEELVNFCTRIVAGRLFDAVMSTGPTEKVWNCHHGVFHEVGCPHLSSCCQAERIVKSSDEGTHYYECMKCEKATDPA